MVPKLLTRLLFGPQNFFDWLIDKLIKRVQIDPFRLENLARCYWWGWKINLDTPIWEIIENQLGIASEIPELKRSNLERLNWFRKIPTVIQSIGRWEANWSWIWMSKNWIANPTEPPNTAASLAQPPPQTQPITQNHHWPTVMRLPPR